MSALRKSETRAKTSIADRASRDVVRTWADGLTPITMARDDNRDEVMSGRHGNLLDCVVEKPDLSLALNRAIRGRRVLL